MERSLAGLTTGSVEGYPPRGMVSLIRRVGKWVEGWEGAKEEAEGEGVGGTGRGNVKGVGEGGEGGER